ncbi:MAG: ABC transporter permease [Eubacterium sp.]|nr:ABC transporter permease [Eubacterium sp.]
MKRFWSDLKKHNGYALYAAKAELKAEVASSYLNWVWWVLEPLCFMIIYSIVFGYIFNAKEKNFSLFIFIGITAWDFFSRNLRNSVRMVKRNKPIVSKVYMPKFILILSKMYVNGFKMVISFGIIVIMLAIYRVPVTVNIVLVIPLLVILWILSFGLMCILLHFGVFIDDLSNIINLLLKFVFYMTGIFYNIETRIGKKSPMLGSLVGECNPMAYLIISFRKVILYGERPKFILIAVWFVVSCLISIYGIQLIYKNENSYVKVI